MAGRPSKMTDAVRKRVIKRYNSGDDLETIARRAIRAHKAALAEADREA